MNKKILSIKELEKELIEDMKELIGEGDAEYNHSRADDLLVIMLRKLGYNELCDLYEEVDKWYA